MSLSDVYNTLDIRVEAGVCTFLINHKHPACVMTDELSAELQAAVRAAEADAAVRVMIFRSSDPDFFIAHRDVTSIIKWAKDGGGERFGPEKVKEAEQGNSPKSYREILRTSRKVSIVEIAGRAGGGGNELAAACDMRFGLVGKTRINQMEVPLGILPGGNGTINLPKLIGRNRALEVILGGVDMDAETAEKWGYLNRIFASREALTAHVNMLATRIASFTELSVGNSKQSVNNALSMSQEEAINQEFILFAELVRDPAALKLMTAFVEQAGGQTRAGELKIDELAPYLPLSKL